MMSEKFSEHVTFSGEIPFEICFSGGGKYATASDSIIKSEIDIVITKINQFSTINPIDENIILFLHNPNGDYEIIKRN